MIDSRPVAARSVQLSALIPALLLALLVASCASTSSLPDGESQWISGRISVRVDASPVQIAQSMSAGFELRAGGVQSSQGELRLNSPLGTRLVTAQWAGDAATLSTASGEQRFESLDDLSRQTLGEPLPLAALADWLSGRPWPGSPHKTFDTGFEQMGWRVQLARKSEGLIEATRAAAPAVSVRVRLDEPLP